jgi:hypothetical protein
MQKGLPPAGVGALCEQGALGRLLLGPTPFAQLFVAG